MPRIVAGWAGSLQLAVPQGGTRPTSDRVREALFGVLDARGAVAGAAVLDLYAGSGALGLEALSRGAASAVLVDRAPAAARAMRENVARLRRAAPGVLDVRVVQQAVGAYLAAAPSADLVLLDPPYDLAEERVTEDLVVVAALLAPGGIAVVERAARSPVPEAPAGLEPLDARRYGDTAVHLLRRG